MKFRSLPTEVQQRVDPQQYEGLELITTLRYDPSLQRLTRHVPICMDESFEQKFFLSYLHYQRLKQGAKLLGWDVENLNYSRVCDLLSTVAGNDPLAIRLSFAQHDKLDISTRKVEERQNLFDGLIHGTPGKDPVYEVFVDPKRYPIKELGPFKTSDRKLYNELRDKYDIKPGDHREVLLVNDAGQLVEGSITSVAVKRDGQWVCPLLKDGGVTSVVGSFLLDLGYIKEGEIVASDLTENEEVLLFNGVAGVVRGIITKI